MEYKKVPNIISTKDLSYFEDAFKWNFTAYKCLYANKGKVKNQKLLPSINQALDLLYSNMENILKILNEGGTHAKN